MMRELQIGDVVITLTRFWRRPNLLAVVTAKAGKYVRLTTNAASRWVNRRRCVLLSEYSVIPDQVPEGMESLTSWLRACGKMSVLLKAAEVRRAN